MDDAATMCPIDSIGDLLSHISALIERKRTALKAIDQRLAFEMLHHHESMPFSLPMSWSTQMCG